jgi:rhamnosyltransferase subunit B
MRIVVAALGSHGDLNPHLAIALALRDRNHSVVVASSAAYAGRVEDLGLGFAAIPPDLPDWRRTPGLVASMMDPLRGTERVVRNLVLPALQASFQAVSPLVAEADLVVSGVLAFAARLAAEVHQTSWVSTALQPAVMFSIMDPPAIAGLPGGGELRRLPVAGRRAVLGAGNWLTDRWMAPYYAIRRNLGLPPDDSHPLVLGQHSPRCSIALFSRHFAPAAADWPGSVRQCGFPFDPRVDDGALPAGVREFLDAGSEPVVFTLGSAAVLEPGRFFDESIAAARALGRRALLLSGPDGTSGLVYRNPDIWSEPWLPHAAIFPRAAAIVHQGGIGTMSHALASGRPMLVVPHGHDQPDNARRAAELGVARVIPAGRYERRKAADALSMLLSSPGWRVRSGELAALIREERGGEVAADLIGQVFA